MTHPKRTTQDTAFVVRMDQVTLKTADGLSFRNTSWTWKRGQHWVIRGPNGSGTSLLARALAGYVPVVRGELVYGFPPPPGQGHEEAIAMVSSGQAHEYGLDGPPSSRWFSLEHLDMPSVLEFLSRERIEEINPFEVDGPPRRSPREFARDQKRIIKLLGIGSLEDRDMLALSNGERRKVLIARALLKRPQLLILDEPFAGLDVASRQHFSQVITTLIRENRIHVLLVTMRPDEVPPGFTHELRIDRHRVVSSGPRFVTGRLKVKGRRSNVLKSDRPQRMRLSLKGKPVIELKHVMVTYDKQCILNNFSWSVREGESWAILGPNGSGKTTLLSLITGDNPQAYANDVAVFGTKRGEEGSLWELRRRIGVVSPDELLGCDGDMACDDLVCPGWDDPDLEAPTPHQRRVARHWLKALVPGLQRDSRFGDLSLGMQQMVLLARALAKEPGVLVLDEPCQGLDQVYRRRFIRAVEKIIKKQRLTVLYVTHHRDELPRGLCHTLMLPWDQE